jgi:hypothetical protein
MVAFNFHVAFSYAFSPTSPKQNQRLDTRIINNLGNGKEMLLLQKLKSMVHSIRTSQTLQRLCSVGMMVAIVGFLSDSAGVISFVGQLWRGDSNTLSVVQARLKPYRISPGNTEGQDDVFVQLQLRNYGRDPVYLTSAKIKIVKSDTATLGRPGVFGQCVLTDIPNENTPIKVEPGDTVWLRVSGSVHLPGMAAWLESGVLEDIHVLAPEDPFTITENFFVDDVNKSFSTLFGSDSAIELTLYSGNQKALQKFDFKLAKGKDIFAKDGSLQQDWLIANWIYPRWAPGKVDASCKDEPS